MHQQVLQFLLHTTPEHWEERLFADRLNKFCFPCNTVGSAFLVVLEATMPQDLASCRVRAPSDYSSQVLDMVMSHSKAAQTMTQSSLNCSTQLSRCCYWFVWGRCRTKSPGSNNISCQSTDKLIFNVLSATRRAKKCKIAYIYYAFCNSESSKVQNSIYLLCFLQFGEPQSAKSLIYSAFCNPNS